MKKILLFSATWCNPCKTLKPILEQIESEENIKIEKFDADKDIEKLKELGVRNVPTMLFLNDDVVYEKTVGVQSKEQILTILKK